MWNYLLRWLRKIRHFKHYSTVKTPTNVSRKYCYIFATHEKKHLTILKRLLKSINNWKQSGVISSYMQHFTFLMFFSIRVEWIKCKELKVRYPFLRFKRVIQETVRINKVRTNHNCIILFFLSHINSKPAYQTPNVSHHPRQLKNFKEIIISQVKRI